MIGFISFFMFTLVVAVASAPLIQTLMGGIF